MRASRTATVEVQDPRPPPAGRPDTPRHLRRLLAGAAVGLPVIGLTAVAVDRHQRQVDQTSVAELSLSVVAGRAVDSLDDGYVVLGLRNSGPRTLRVASARIEFPGYDTVAIGRDVPALGTVALRLPATPSCRLAWPSSAGLRLLTEVVTVHGSRHWLMLPLRPSGIERAVRTAAAANPRAGCA